MKQVVNKKITLSLVGLDGNAFFLMRAFQRQARKEGWRQEEINAVIKEAMSSDHNHLLAVLDCHCEPKETES